MSGCQSLLELIKVTAVSSVNSTFPPIVVFGSVTSEAPLCVKINNKITLEEDELILTRTVTDYETDMTVDHTVEKRAGGGGHASFDAHNHQYKGRKSFTVHHKLKSGDGVVLLRVQGGEKYVILDRVAQ